MRTSSDQKATPAPATPPKPRNSNNDKPATPGKDNATPAPAADPGAAPDANKPQDVDYQLSRALDLLRGLALFQKAQAN